MFAICECICMFHCSFPPSLVPAWRMACWSWSQQNVGSWKPPNDEWLKGSHMGLPMPCALSLLPSSLTLIYYKNMITRLYQVSSNNVFISAAATAPVWPHTETMLLLIALCTVEGPLNHVKSLNSSLFIFLYAISK